MPTNNDPFTKIQRARDSLNNVQSNKQQALGRIQTYLEQLRSGFGVDTLDKARNKLSVINRQIERKHNEFQIKYRQLLQEHPWIDEL